MPEDDVGITADSRLPDRRTGPLQSLSVQLFLWLFAVVLIAFALYAYVNIRKTSEQWTQSLFQTVTRTSELIKRSTRYSMLLDRKEDVQQAVRMITQETGVTAVRIYDKQGTIVFSGEEDDIGQKIDPQSDACLVCHDQSRQGDAVPRASPVRVFRAPDGTRILGLTSPIENETACRTGTCHVHPEDQTVLGILDIEMSMAYADRHLAITKRQMLIAAFVMALITGAVSALFIYRVVRKPVRQLMSGTEQIARGDLETHIEVGAANEMGQLACAFNRMSHDLSQAKREITEWSRSLEQKVVAKTQELGRAQRQIVHMEKMASLGKLATAVAHELNNPLSAILMYARLVARELDGGAVLGEKGEEVVRYLEQVQKDAGRCGNVVRNLLLFARPSGGDFALHRVNQIVERSLVLVRHHLQMAHIELDSQLLAVDHEIVCDADELQQAFVALLVNAVEAMPAGGRLSVRMALQGGWVCVDISDTGVSIPEEILPHIFEPFFSTKEEQSGVGLGLAVVYGIVQRHGGEIEVDSKANRGTTVRLRLPERLPATRGNETVDGANAAGRKQKGATPRARRVSEGT